MGVGLSLRHLQRSQKPLPLSCNVEIIRFAADILNDAMKNGFVHGDIKLDNLSVLNDGSLIINGYDRPRRNSITPEGTISLQGDIYGLGIVMLELLSGQSSIELPLDEGLHNQKVLQIFLTINWQEWAQQPWLSTMQEYLISLLFYAPSQRPHPLDIANILKEASLTTTSPGIRQFMQHHGLRVSSDKESLEMAQALRSSTLISPVEVMADSEGTATGFFTRDKIAEMFQEPIAEDKVRRTEWSPEASLDLEPPQKSNTPTWQQPSPPVQEQPTPTLPPAPTWQQPPPPKPPAPTPPPTPAWQQPPPPVQEQPTATNPTPPWQPPPTPKPTPAWQQPPPVQEQPTPSLPPTPAWQQPPLPKPPAPEPPPTPAWQQPPPPAHAQPNISIGMGAQPPPEPSQNWNQPPQPTFSAGGTIAPPPSMPEQSMQGGIDKKWLIIGGIGLVVLLLIIGVLLWKVMGSENTEPSNNDQEIQVETLAPSQPNDDIEELDDEDIEIEEEVEEPEPPVEKQKQKPKPKATTPVQKSKPARKTTTKPTKTTKPKEVTPAPTVVGAGEFTTLIKFAKAATLKCGDGQTKDFVRQTRMTFSTRTACRISTEDGETGALSASKSGTIECTLSGSRIRCR